MQMAEFRDQTADEDRRYDRFEAPDGIRYNQDGSLTLRRSEQTYPLADEALRYLGQIIETPVTYLRKLPSDVRYSLVSQLLEPRQDALSVITYDGNVVGLANPQLPTLEGSRVVHTVETVLTKKGHPAAEFDVARIRDGHRASFAVLSQAAANGGLVQEMKVGDVVNGGVRICYSRVPGLNKGTPPEIQTYLNRLVCTNGMTLETGGVTWRMVGSTEDWVLERLAEGTESAIDSIDEMIEKFKRAQDVEVQGVSALRRVAQEYGLTKRLQDMIAARFEQEDNQGSLYAVVNAITACANSQDLPTPDCEKLQAVAGSITDTIDVQRCTTCYSRLQ